MSQSRRFPSLDGWRAVSIVLVLGSHSKSVIGFPKSLDSVFNWLFDGDLGVRFFFVISGFLITYLLLQEFNRNETVSLRNFYIRRALRILPVYFAFLLVVFLLQVFTPWHQSQIAWIGNLTFTTNFIGGYWTTGHLWSLAVEEQFYLLWPLLLVYFGLKRNNWTVFYIIGIPLIFAPVCRVITYMKLSPAVLHPLFQYFSFLNYFDSLAVGCLVAVFLNRHELQIAALLNKLKSQSIFLGLVLILIPYTFTKLLRFGIFTVPLGDTFQALGFAILLLQSILSPQLFKPLNWPVIKTLGVLSYSIYIWQMIFCSNPQSFGFSNVWFMSFPGWLLAAVLVAAASYYGLEKPLLGLRSKLRSRNI